MRYKGKTVIYDLMTGLGLLGITISNKKQTIMDTGYWYKYTSSQIIILKERDDGKKNKTMASPSDSACI